MEVRFLLRIYRTLHSKRATLMSGDERGKSPTQAKTGLEWATSPRFRLARLRRQQGHTGRNAERGHPAAAVHAFMQEDLCHDGIRGKG